LHRSRARSGTRAAPRIGGAKTKQRSFTAATVRTFAQTLRRIALSADIRRLVGLRPEKRRRIEVADMAKSKPAKHKPGKKDAKAKPARPKAAASQKPAAKSKRPEKAHAAEKPKPAPAKGKPDAKAHPDVKGKGVPTAPAPAPAATDGRPAKAAEGKPGKPEKKGRKSSRRPTLLRRGPDGEILAPGDLLLPGGTQRLEEILYLFRGCAAAEHPNLGDEAVAEVFARRPLTGEFPGDKDELAKMIVWARDRFERGTIEPVIPPRGNLRRSFQGVVERARHRRREIGAFLRGLDIGHTETSHMDAHGEASLQSLMEWAARLENLTEADEPNQADYGQFHRGLDQLESTTEALIIDVEQTLRRLRDRLKA
jgi:hypothetical protein